MPSAAKNTSLGTDGATRLVEVASYSYVDPTGREVFQKVRYEPKSFAYRAIPYSWAEVGDRYVASINGRPYVYRKPPDADEFLYHLPEVLKAKESGRDIYWCEGEKDADALRSVGCVATSHHGGAGAVYAAQCKHLNGACRVVLCVDRDIPGAYDGLLRLGGIRSQVGVVELVKAEVGKDVSAHLQAGYGVQDLVPVPVETLREVTANYTPPELARSMARAGYSSEFAEQWREMAAFWAANPGYVWKPIVERKRKAS